MGFWSTITGVQGKRDREEAEYIVASAQRRLENYKESLVEEEENTKNSLECLGEEKLKIALRLHVVLEKTVESIFEKTSQPTWLKHSAFLEINFKTFKKI